VRLRQDVERQRGEDPPTHTSESGGDRTQRGEGSYATSMETIKGCRMPSPNPRGASVVVEIYLVCGSSDAGGGGEGGGEVIKHRSARLNNVRKRALKTTKQCCFFCTERERDMSASTRPVSSAPFCCG
jgi:hypothetical protein